MQCFPLRHYSFFLLSCQFQITPCPSPGVALGLWMPAAQRKNKAEPRSPLVTHSTALATGRLAPKSRQRAALILGICTMGTQGCSAPVRTRPWLSPTPNTPGLALQTCKSSSVLITLVQPLSHHLPSHHKHSGQSVKETDSKKQNLN